MDLNQAEILNTVTKYNLFFDSKKVVIMHICKKMRTESLLINGKKFSLKQKHLSSNLGLNLYDKSS